MKGSPLPRLRPASSELSWHSCSIPGRIDGLTDIRLDTLLRRRRAVRLQRAGLALGQSMVSSLDAFSYRNDPNVAAFPDDHPIIIYDGKCRLCSGFVRFVLRHDRGDHFRFIAAQSPLGEALYRHYDLRPVDFETNILLERGRPWLKSESSLRIFEQLGFPWSLASLGRILPLALRDKLYEIIARNRLKWFGVREVCFLHDPGQEHRFLG
jgi:predicted DCC family thiol-disulfide oxidoreductase YuxK